MQKPQRSFTGWLKHRPRYPLPRRYYVEFGCRFSVSSSETHRKKKRINEVIYNLAMPQTLVVVTVGHNSIIASYIVRLVTMMSLKPGYVINWLTEWSRQDYSVIIIPFSLALIYMIWRLWKFTLKPLLRPDEPKELPYWIPGTSSLH
jgi:hypothetical protein